MLASRLLPKLKEDLLEPLYLTLCLFEMREK